MFNTNFAMTDHCRGYVDAQLKIDAAEGETPEYYAGHTAGLRDRVYDAQMQIDSIKHKHNVSVFVLSNSPPHGNSPNRRRSDV